MSIEKKEKGLITNNEVVIPPAIIKYMGSKRELIKFVVDGIRDIHQGELICDLFAGTAIVGACLKNDAQIWSNDIQAYSEFFAKSYLDFDPKKFDEKILTDISKIAEEHVTDIKRTTSLVEKHYKDELTLTEFQSIEQQQQGLINSDFTNVDFHLFSKYYSGTYWSFEQCAWIDGYKKASERYNNESVQPIIMSSLMHAMAYNAQSTGHYAQYRDANKVDSMKDIIIYRRKSIKEYFERKFVELSSKLEGNKKKNFHSSLDYKECLTRIPDGSLVYADPPYNFVHYSRFYHAIETLVKYDYPEIKFKGRYRTDRHQSPFCQKTNVKKAFIRMFEITSSKRLKLVLSYSNNGLITFDSIVDLAKKSTKGYDIKIKQQSYVHSTMGRSEDKSRNVKEILITLTPSI